MDGVRLLGDQSRFDQLLHHFLLLPETQGAQPDHLRSLAPICQKTEVVAHLHCVLLALLAYLHRILDCCFSLLAQRAETHLLNVILALFEEAVIDVFYFFPEGVDLLALRFLRIHRLTYDATQFFYFAVCSPVKFLGLDGPVSCYFETLRLVFEGHFLDESFLKVRVETGGWRRCSYFDCYVLVSYLFWFSDFDFVGVYWHLLMFFCEGNRSLDIHGKARLFRFDLCFCHLAVHVFLLLGSQTLPRLGLHRLLYFLDRKHFGPRPRVAATILPLFLGGEGVFGFVFLFWAAEEGLSVGGLGTGVEVAVLSFREFEVLFCGCAVQEGVLGVAAGSPELWDIGLMVGLGCKDEGFFRVEEVSRYHCF